MEDAIEKRRAKGIALLNARRVVIGSVDCVGNCGEQRSIPDIDAGVAEVEEALRNLAKTLVRLMRVA